MYKHSNFPLVWCQCVYLAVYVHLDASSSNTPHAQMYIHTSQTLYEFCNNDTCALFTIWTNYYTIRCNDWILYYNNNNYYYHYFALLLIILHFFHCVDVVNVLANCNTWKAKAYKLFAWQFVSAIQTLLLLLGLSSMPLLLLLLFKSAS